MALWKPSDKVTPNELIGRRIVDKTPRKADGNGVPILQINDFHEKREGSDLSVDRLGNPNPSKETLLAVTNLADRDAGEREPPHTFLGWASIMVKYLAFPSWAATAKIRSAPTVDEQGKVGNPWHAEISKEGFRDKAQSYALAATLRQVFEQKGNFVQPQRDRTAQPLAHTTKFPTSSIR